MRVASHRVATPALALVAAVGLLGAGCTSPTAPPRERPVALASVDVRTLESTIPDHTYDAACETGANVILRAQGSHDPAGQRLTYEWRDVVDGYLSPDFTPRTNPMRTDQVETAISFFSIGTHELTLTVTASDGRKSSTTLRILVNPCSCGG